MRPNEEVCMQSDGNSTKYAFSRDMDNTCKSKDHTIHERCEDIEACHFSNGER